MLSRTHRIVAVAAALVCLPLGMQAVAAESGKVRVLSDGAGDANGLVAVTAAPSTAPASVDSADLVHVDLEGSGADIRLRFGLTELPDVGGRSLQTFYRWSATVGDCRFHLGAITGTLTPTTPAPGLAAFFDPISGCPDGTEIIQAEEEWTAELDAATGEVVVTFPLSSLDEHVPGIGPGARLTATSADTSIGTYAFTGGSGPDAERYTTAILDAAPGGLDYVIPCSEQQC